MAPSGEKPVLRPMTLREPLVQPACREVHPRLPNSTAGTQLFALQLELSFLSVFQAESWQYLSRSLSLIESPLAGSSPCCFS